MATLPKYDEYIGTLKEYPHHSCIIDLVKQEVRINYNIIIPIVNRQELNIDGNPSNLYIYKRKNQSLYVSTRKPNLNR